MNPATTALVLTGYQEDYFSNTGALADFLPDRLGIQTLLTRTCELVERLAPTPTLIISTPICFTRDYSELVAPMGILEAIRARGAFRTGSPGVATVPELKCFGDRLLEVQGKRGLNAFNQTDLAQVLESRGIKDVVFAGVVTSLCIDSSARSAFERGFRVHVVSDCLGARTEFEQTFYLEQVFPLYASVLSSLDLAERLRLPCEVSQ